MAQYLIESALLTHGLPGISNEVLKTEWPVMHNYITWMEEGRIVIEGIHQFCRFRSQAHFADRIHAGNFWKKQQEKATGALTASATILVCKERGIPLAVAGGIGGLKRGQERNACHDLVALGKGKVSLLATSPKDMFDLKYTIKAFRQEGIQILGSKKSVCNGYVFLGEEIHLDGTIEEQISEGPCLILNEIPEQKRIMEKEILNQAILYGKMREREGASFHPAVNEKLEEKTKGYSSLIQLWSIIDNIKLADLLAE